MSGDFSNEERAGLYKAIYTRRDVRSHFVSRPIDDSILAKVLHAAHHAPSVGFSQPWNFILVKNNQTRCQIKESFESERQRSAQMIDDEAKKSRYLSFKLEGILESALNICVTYDPTKFGPFVLGRTSVPEAGLYSVCCAVQNLWLAARTEGIGIGWVSILSIDALRDALHIPQHVTPVAYLCMGYVDEFAQKPDLEEAGWLPRLDLADVIYFEKWSDKNDNNRSLPIANHWQAMSDMIKNIKYAHTDLDMRHQDDSDRLAG